MDVLTLHLRLEALQDFRVEIKIACTALIEVWCREVGVLRVRRPREDEVWERHESKYRVIVVGQCESQWDRVLQGVLKEHETGDGCAGSELDIVSAVQLVTGCRHTSMI